MQEEEENLDEYGGEIDEEEKDDEEMEDESDYGEEGEDDGETRANAKLNGDHVSF